MSPKKKFSKHDMKEDQFIKTVFQLREWTMQHLNMVIITVGAVILVIMAIWYLSASAEKKEQQAYDLLGRAEMEARSDQPQLAIIDLQKVLDDYGSSQAAKLAALRLANLYFDQNDCEKAETAFREYVDNYLIDDISRLSAREGIAASLAGMGKFAESGREYLDVAQLDPGGVTYEDNLFYAVSNFIKAGDRENAQQAFALLQEKGITSERFRMAKILMIENGFLVYEEGDFKSN